MLHLMYSPLETQSLFFFSPSLTAAARVYVFVRAPGSRRASQFVDLGSLHRFPMQERVVHGV